MPQICRNAGGGKSDRNLAKDGFAAATQWLAGADLTADELKRFASRLPSSAKAAERGQWIDWIGKTLPPDKASDCIWQNVTGWTKADYQAAGKWLAATPEGPTKITAIRAYAGSVASIEPETAAQWAMTLPPGKDRDETLATIYQKWPRGQADIAKTLPGFQRRTTTSKQSCSKGSHIPRLFENPGNK